MKTNATNQVASVLVLIVGFILLCVGVLGNINDRSLAVAGAVLIGSWHIARVLASR